jgi:hypothetical protein
VQSNLQASPRYDGLTCCLRNLQQANMIVFVTRASLFLDERAFFLPGLALAAACADLTPHD